MTVLSVLREALRAVPSPFRPPSEATPPHLHLHACTNFSRCTRFSVFVHGLDHAKSSEFRELWEPPSDLIELSRHPDEACMVIVPIDSRTHRIVGQTAGGSGLEAMSRLQGWNGGLNHVVVDRSDVGISLAQRRQWLGCAALAQSHCELTNFVPDFDISLPLSLPSPHRTDYGAHAAAHVAARSPARFPVPGPCPSVMPTSCRMRASAHLGATGPTGARVVGGRRSLAAIEEVALHGRPGARRRYFLTFRGSMLYSSGSEKRALLLPLARQTTSQRPVAVYGRCNLKQASPEQRPLCMQMNNETLGAPPYLSLLNTTFALVPGGISPASMRLAEVLAAGAVPVFVSGDVRSSAAYVRPYDGLVPWHTMSLHFPWEAAGSIVQALERIPSRTIVKMQAAVRNAWLKHFRPPRDSQTFYELLEARANFRYRRRRRLAAAAASSSRPSQRLPGGRPGLFRPHRPHPAHGPLPFDGWPVQISFEALLDR